MTTTDRNTAAAPLVGQVYAATDDPRVRESELLGALLEGGSWAGPWSVGDGGTSGGPFQIHWTVHPDVVAEARRRGVTPQQLVEDPAYAVQWMTPQYLAAVAQVPADTWASNPELAAETAARLAEKPARDYYSTHGTHTVDAAWATTSQQIGGQDPALPATTPGGSPAPSTASTTPTGHKPGTVHVTIPIPIPGVPDISFDFPWARISLFLLGGVLIVVGLKLTFSGGGGDSEEEPAPHFGGPLVEAEA